jgi:hypothetical protein
VAAIHVISAITDQLVCCVAVALFDFIQMVAAIGLAAGDRRPLHELVLLSMR